VHALHPGVAFVRTRLLFDKDVRGHLTPTLAVEAARAALIDAYQGRLVSPPRTHTMVGPGALVFTAGGYANGKCGVRVYQTGRDASDQVVLVWAGDGRLSGCIVGAELGSMRTGALGAAATGALARADAEIVSVIGSGRQAWAQLWALTAVRQAVEVRVYSPNERHRRAFAERAVSELGLDATPVATAQQAVEGADIIILATVSEQPVISSAWVAAGAHVNTVGPKLVSAHETPPDLAANAAVVVSDSPGQAAAYGEPFFTSRELTHLGALLCNDTPGRTSDTDITMYASTGLAGSEVVVANAMLDRLDAES
jgi:alanine dehydrogenase